MKRGSVLVVDDKENMRKLLGEVLSEQYEVTLAEDGRRALALLAAGDFDVVVSDIRMPDVDGYTLLSESQALRPEVEVILITAFGSIPRAVEAMKKGAFHYLKKPFEPDELLLLVDRALERRRLAQRARRLEQELRSVTRLDRLVGKSRAMQKLFGLIRRAAASEATVLITGESGTGKELVARAIHASSARERAAFVAINCGALPENLVESELFGHVRGAFTGAIEDKPGLFEEADGGTLFLDEVGELPQPLQIKLTRALQESRIRRIGAARERSVDVRIVAATNADLKQAMRDGRFREDLFYRLNIFAIEVPPLRARPEDIPALCAHFLERHGSRQSDQAVKGLSPDALATLMRHGWPGNVRELENTVERALAVADGPRIELEHLPDELSERTARGRTAADTHLTHREYVDLARERASREYLTMLMREFEGNVTRAAQRAGTERESLHRLLKRHGIQASDFKKS